MALGKLRAPIEHILAIGKRVDSPSDATDSTIVSLLRMLQKAKKGSFGEIVRKTVAFDGSTGGGEVGTVALFTVTGDVRAKITAVCSETLVGAGTIEVGITGATAAIIAQVADATTLAAGEIWHDATPDAKIELDSVAPVNIIAGGMDVFLTVGTANVTAGTIKFVCEWEPISSDGAVVAA